MDRLQDLYDSEINFRISCLWDGGIDWAVGDEINTFTAKGSAPTVDAAIAEICIVAANQYPDSTFAKKYARR